MSNNILEAPLEVKEIMNYLPHRYPFLLIDRVISMELEPLKRLVAVKNITMTEPCFQGHFPGNPVFPGVLMIESMAQAAGMLANLAAVTEGKDGELFYLVRVDKARFSQLVVPGDQVELEVIQQRIMRRMGLYTAQASVNGKKVASCELLCAGRSE
jgi:3-hydroxyacyl-[acyl-carrier-protein] dehydratase